MKIYRGNIGVDLTLEEFSEIIEDSYKLEELLELIYELEMDEVMNYNQEDIKNFQKGLFEEVSQYQKKQETDKDLDKMARILKRLEKYDR